MIKFLAFIGLSFLCAMLLSVAVGVVRGLMLRRRAKEEAAAQIELDDEDPGDSLSDLHDDLL